MIKVGLLLTTVACAGAIGFGAWICALDYGSAQPSWQAASANVATVAGIPLSSDNTRVAKDGTVVVLYGENAMVFAEDGRVLKQLNGAVRGGWRVANGHQVFKYVTYDGRCWVYDPASPLEVAQAGGPVYPASVSVGGPGSPPSN